jgi:TPR repeat protein
MKHSEESIQSSLGLLAQAMERDDKNGIAAQLDILSSLERPQTYASIAASYEFGNFNISPRDDLAFEWYLKSALEEDNCESFFDVGRYYFHGKHVERSLEKSSNYYEIAHRKGSYVAGIMLAYRSIHGIGVPVDLDKSEQYLASALAEGYVAARVLLYKIYFMRRKYFLGLRVWVRCVLDVIQLVFNDQHSPKLYALKTEAMRWEDIAMAKKESLEWSKNASGRDMHDGKQRGSGNSAAR